MKYTPRNNERSGSYGRTGGKKFGASGDSRRSSFSRGGDRPTRPFRAGDDRFDRPQLHDATCAGCGKPCQVPFKPNGSKPIFCRNCFKKDGSVTTTGKYAKRPSYGETRREESDVVYAERPRAAVATSKPMDLAKIEARLASIEQKLDMLIESVTVDEEDEDEDDEESDGK